MSEKKITHTEHYRDYCGRWQTRTWTTDAPKPLSELEVVGLAIVGIICVIASVLYDAYQWVTAHLLWTGSAVVVIVISFALYRMISGIRLEDDWYMYPLYWVSDAVGYVTSWFRW